MIDELLETMEEFLRNRPPDMSIVAGSRDALVAQFPVLSDPDPLTKLAGIPVYYDPTMAPEAFELLPMADIRKRLGLP